MLALSFFACLLKEKQRKERMEVRDDKDMETQLELELSVDQEFIRDRDLVCTICHLVTPTAIIGGQEKDECQHTFCSREWMDQDEDAELLFMISFQTTDF